MFTTPIYNYILFKNYYGYLDNDELLFFKVTNAQKAH